MIPLFGGAAPAAPAERGVAGRGAGPAHRGDADVVNAGGVDAALAPDCLAMVTDRIVPMLLAEELECDWSIGFCIAALDVPPTAKAIAVARDGTMSADGQPFAKLGVVVLIVLYHWICARMLRALAANTDQHSHRWFRWFNEVPVLLLVVAVALVVVKPF